MKAQWRCDIFAIKFCEAQEEKEKPTLHSQRHRIKQSVYANLNKLRDEKPAQARLICRRDSCDVTLDGAERLDQQALVNRGS